ncbi:MAG: ABC-F family ATP-binding cassette domain-containing protein [Acidobacteria bacterium]|nr:ABC-F family ATP-binding cassette domain-containing protein [Acidobacteriota bacterium]
MPPILNAQSLSKRFGAKPLFENVSFTINDGDRIGLIGPNGAGKSTLMKILAGEEDTDSGEVAIRKRARVGYVTQNSEFAPGLSVRAVLEHALAAAHVPDAEREQRLREMIGRAGFTDEHAEAAKLSGGWRKRLAIVEAVVTQPDVLLLDEPTNHLDLGGIHWLEELLQQAPFASVIVSHDRYFLEAVANETMELSRVYAEGLLRVKGKYSKFLEERELYLAAQSKQQDALRNKVKTEIEWLRRGPKARTTKSKARIDKAHEMIGQLADVNERTRTSTAAIDFAATDRQTKRLVELDGVSCRLGDRTILDNLDFVITAGMRLGLVGPNGSGKTTLLKLLTGELESTSGAIKRAQMLRTVYFSQNREIDTSLTLRKALSPEGDSVVFNGRQVHVASWAARFLFTGEQLNQPVERLSGGERARVLIARLMLQPADLLLMDEPTNDLDIPTLEILEESLLEYPGALVLVTHDRYMLDRVSNVVLGLDGKGASERFADFAQWEEWMLERDGDLSEEMLSLGPKASETKKSSPPTKKKLSYLDQRDWDTIEERVEKAEARLNAAHDKLDDPAIATDPAALQKALDEQAAAQEAADVLYARWAELAEKAG